MAMAGEAEENSGRFQVSFVYKCIFNVYEYWIKKVSLSVCSLICDKKEKRKKEKGYMFFGGIYV